MIILHPFLKRKAVSPVIATVIIVAVAITIAVGVSSWIGGVSSQITNFEKVEFQTGYAEVDTGTLTTGWDIEMTLKNSGTVPSTIISVFVNDIPVDNYGASAISEVAGETSTDISNEGVNLSSGQSGIVHVWIASGGSNTLSAGTMVNIKLHSSGGMEYIKLIRLK